MYALSGYALLTCSERADEQTCIDYAKKLIDELGRDGGYIFSPE